MRLVSLNVPEASITAYASKPSPVAWMAGKARQTSVETPAMMSFLRPVASTALANRGSSNALTVVRLMIEMPGKASVSSGMIGPHISGEVAVTIIGTPKTLTARTILRGRLQPENLPAQDYKSGSRNPAVRGRVRDSRHSRQTFALV